TDPAGSPAPAPGGAVAGRTSGHVRVGVVRRGYEVLLDHSWRDPPEQVVPGAGLVVGPACPGAPEGLLADDRAGRLVVEVEVARRVPQGLGRPGGGPLVVREDRAGQRVRGDPLRLAHHLLEPVVLE